MADKWVKLDVLKYAIQKLQALIDKKADDIHRHLPTDISEDSTHNFVSSIEKEKIAIIKTDGTGNSVLHDDGTYKQLQETNIIDDMNISTTSTYSSNKIDAELKNKSDINHTHDEINKLQQDSHTHINKEVLDNISLEKVTLWDDKSNKIITTGQGDMFLADDGEYKAISTTGSGGVSDWNDLLNKPFNGIDTDTLKVDETTSLLSVKRVVLTKIEYDTLLSENLIDDNTVYIITDDNGVTDGSGTSSAQDSANKILQKSFLNTEINDNLYVDISDTVSNDKCIVQAYKFIEAEDNVVETLKLFNNGDETSFYYNPDGVTFDGSMHIKDKYSLSFEMNNEGFYESNIIDKSMFLNMDRIEVI